MEMLLMPENETHSYAKELRVSKGYTESKIV
jgi:hypothetical protein